MFSCDPARLLPGLRLIHRLSPARLDEIVGGNVDGGVVGELSLPLLKIYTPRDAKSTRQIKCARC